MKTLINKFLPYTLVLLLSCSKSPQALPQADIDQSFSAAEEKGLVYLNFKGGNVSSTYWKVSSVAASGISGAEQAIIFDSVVRCLSGFAISVTTNETVFKTTTARYKMKVFVTSSYEWMGDVSGIARLNSIYEHYAPCFVFSPKVSYNPQATARVIVHEVGHTFGLRHQNASNGYMRRVPEWGWVAAYNEVGQWQDDKQIISHILNQ